MWRFFHVAPPRNRVLETRFISQPFKRRFVCDAISYWAISKITPLHSPSPYHSHTYTFTPLSVILSLSHSRPLTLTHRATLTQSPLSRTLSTLKQPLHSHSPSSLTHPLHSHSPSPLALSLHSQRHKDSQFLTLILSNPHPD